MLTTLTTIAMTAVLYAKGRIEWTSSCHRIRRLTTSTSLVAKVTPTVNEKFIGKTECIRPLWPPTVHRVRAPDDAFADPKQAALYDFFDGDRSDLDLYLSIAEEVDADSIVDIGCGTGSLAVRLAEGGKTVVGVDPAAASLAVARGKTNAAEQVKVIETIGVYALCMRASWGWLIQAVCGSFGAWGRRPRNRAGLAW